MYEGGELAYLMSARVERQDVQRSGQLENGQDGTENSFVKTLVKMNEPRAASLEQKLRTRAHTTRTQRKSEQGSSSGN